MNKQSRIARAAVPSAPAIGAAATPHGAQAEQRAEGEAEGFSPVPSVSPTYQLRTLDCPVCDRATAVSCEFCWSSGEIDARCVECDRDKPLNDEGVCEQCFDAGELPIAAFEAKYLHTQAMQSREAY